jgi:hypothetical protein
VVVFIALGSVEQADHAGLDQVVDLDTGRQLGRQLQRDPSHQRRM